MRVFFLPQFSLNMKKLMNKILISSIKVILILGCVFSVSHKVYAEDPEKILDQLQVLQQDIKTLEKAVYSEDFKSSVNSKTLPNNSGDVLTKHLLKLSELEEQFKILTNSFEEINFKLDKLSNRITKVQTDNQMRFQDLEKSGLSSNVTKKKLPGSGEQKELGSVSETEVTSAEQMQVQATQSVESVGTVIGSILSRGVMRPSIIPGSIR